MSSSPVSNNHSRIPYEFTEYMYNTPVSVPPSELVEGLSTSEGAYEETDNEMREEMLEDASERLTPSKSRSVYRNSGRKKLPIWSHYTQIGNKAGCNYCFTVVRGRPNEIMKTHILSCRKAQIAGVSLKKIYPNLINRPAKQAQAPMSGKEKIDELLVHCLVETGVPFSFLDNPAFRKYSQALNPQYKPFSRYTFTHSLMYQHLVRVEIDLAEKLEKVNHFTLSLEGWSSRASKSIYGVIAVAPTGEEYLVDVILLKGDSATAQRIYSELNTSITRLGSDRIAAVVTDGSAKMMALRKLIWRRDSIPSFTCVEHLLNLVCRNIFKCPEVASLFTTASNIIEKFTKSNKLISILKQAQDHIGTGCALSPLAKTRFASSYICLLTLGNNQNAFKNMCSTRSIELSPDLIEEINDDFFWAQVDELVSVLSPLAKAITVCESATMRLSEVFSMAINMVFQMATRLYNSRLPITKKVAENTVMCLDYVKEQVIAHPFFQLAALLDCRYGVVYSDGVMDGIKIIISDQIDERGGTDEFRASVFRELQLFVDNRRTDDLFNPEIFWWKHSRYPELSPLASILFHIVPNSISCERAFSTMGWVDSAHCSNLTADNLTSFCKLRINSKSVKRAQSAVEKKQSLQQASEILGGDILEDIQEKNIQLPTTSKDVNLNTLISEIRALFHSEDCLENFISSKMSETGVEQHSSPKINEIYNVWDKRIKPSAGSQEGR